MLQPRVIATALLAAAALGGCTQGGSSSSIDSKLRGEQRNVAQAVEDLQSAGKDRNAGKICAQILAPDLVRAIERASHKRCDAALDEPLQDADAFDLSVEKVAINGTTAVATVKSDAGDQDRTDRLRLVRDGRIWKVASLGESG